MDSPFEVLRIDPDADEDEVERAYRRRVKEAHPDHGGSSKEFRLVTRAYETITNGGGPDWENATPAEPKADPEPAGTVVEFLDYEVLADRGWELDDDDLFEKAAAAGLDTADYGTFVVDGDDTLLEAAEEDGRSWPFSCRGGACANCAVAVVEGEMELFIDHVLPPELTERGIQLSCIGSPVSGELQVVFNIKDLPALEDLQLPPRPG